MRSQNYIYKFNSYISKYGLDSEQDFSHILYLHQSPHACIGLKAEASLASPKAGTVGRTVPREVNNQ